MNPRLLNSTRVREFALAYCREHRPKFTRVGLNFLLRVEARLKGVLVDEISHHPSKGKTLK